MDIRINGFGDDAILELPPYSVGQTKSHVPVRQISTYSLIDYNGIYGTEIVLISGQRVRAGCYPNDLSRAITASSHAENTRTNEVLRLTRERDEARAEIKTLRNQAVLNLADAERLREHHKIAVDQWTLEAQNVKVLEEENEQLRAEILAHLTRQAQCQGEYDERQRDAERYRWLRKYAEIQFIGFVYDIDRYPEDLDAAIDAAMREGE